MAKFTLSKTYEIWDDESLEIGETDQKGFEYQDSEYESLEDLAREILSCGPVSPSNWPAINGSWFSTVDADIDYQSGETAYYSFHPSALTEKQFTKLCKLLKL